MKNWCIAWPVTTDSVALPMNCYIVFVTVGTCHAHDFVHEIEIKRIFIVNVFYFILGWRKLEGAISGTCMFLIGIKCDKISMNMKNASLKSSSSSNRKSYLWSKKTLYALNTNCLVFCLVFSLLLFPCVILTHLICQSELNKQQHEKNVRRQSP